MDCRYKDLLGKPGEGLHTYRFMGVAIVDVLMTIAAGVALWAILDWPFVATTLVLFTGGIILHRLLCVRTTVDRTLFP